MTVGDLLKHIEKFNIPHDAEILFQRIEDVYFEKHNWKTVNKEGYWYWRCTELNKKIDSGEFYNKEQYPNLEDPEKLRTSPEELEEVKEKYIKAFSPVKYADDNNLYIDAHY